MHVEGEAMPLYSIPYVRPAALSAIYASVGAAHTELTATTLPSNLRVSIVQLCTESCSRFVQYHDWHLPEEHYS